MSATGGAARIRVVEPTGLRELELPLSIAARAASIVLPGVQDGAVLQISRRGAELLATTAMPATLRLNGQAAAAEQILRSDDVLEFGAARILLRRAADGREELQVRHLVGNDTVAPLVRAADRDGDDDNADARVSPVALPPASATDLPPATQTPATAASPRHRAVRGWILAALVVAAAMLWLQSRLVTVALILSPVDARVHADGLVSWQSPGSITLLPGERRLRAERAGYRNATLRVTATAGMANKARILLYKLPGIVDVDSGGVAATALLDGAEVGVVPGVLSVPAGAHTLLLRAPRHLDAVLKLDVLGMGQRQTIKATLPPSWGRLELNSATAGATLQVNDDKAEPLPAALELPAGVQRLKVAAPGARDWLSSVLIKPGETTRVGPVVLGAPDAHLDVRSKPGSAAVTVDGVWRGRTPLQLALPPGARHEVLITQSGYRSVTRVVDATAGAKVAIDVRLDPILVPLRIRGEPVDAQLWIDNEAHGTLPATLQLLAGVHQLEVRHVGLQTWSSAVTLAPDVPRTLEYRLLPLGRPAGWTPPAQFISASNGPSLRLIKGGSFLFGSGRREQGRRPNEGQIRVTLARAFYIGVYEVTNGEFRRFRADHASGVVDRQSIDLDSQAVTGVTWQQAVEYCNWLSAQNGLPAAYESQHGTWTLHQPANTGYRLPTEAEWEFAARMGGASPRRFEWGDELPIPQGVANLAGTEAAKIVDPVLPAYRDDYVAVAAAGRFAANAFGLYDMTGNVSEWTHDVYTSFLDEAAVTDPTGPVAGARHTVRGSSWRSATISELRLAWRDGASEPAQDLGFRIARYAE